MKIYAYITGGGAQWIADKFAEGGASSWFLGAQIPYSQKDFDQLIGGEPWDNKYVSKRTCEQLAVAAFNRAQSISSDGVGFAVSASLHKKGERKDRKNQAYLSVYDGEGIYTRHLEFKKLFTSRRKQEVVLAREMDKFLKDVARNRVIGFYWEEIPNLKHVNGDKLVVYSGSFNPFHKGHLFVLKETRKALGEEYQFIVEISKKHHNKANTISPVEFSYRALKLMCECDKTFSDGWGDMVQETEETGFLFLSKTFVCRQTDIVASDAAKFVDKAAILLGNEVKDLVFVMGDDVYEKISETDKNTLDSWGVKLLVFLRGKEKVDGHPVLHPATFTLPKLPYDISSTELRKKK